MCSVMGGVTSAGARGMDRRRAAVMHSDESRGSELDEEEDAKGEEKDVDNIT